MLLEIIRTVYNGNTPLATRQLEVFLSMKLPEIKNSLVTNTPQLKYHGSRDAGKLVTNKQRGLGTHVGTAQQAELRLNSVARDEGIAPNPAVESYLVDLKNPIRLYDLGTWMELQMGDVFQFLTKYDTIVGRLTFDSFNTKYNQSTTDISVYFNTYLYSERSKYFV